MESNWLLHPGHALIVVLWLGYFLIHSILATRKVKEWVRRHLPVVFRYYRLIYNILAVMLILPILMIAAVMQGPRLLPENVALRYASFFLATWGVIVMRLAFREFSFKEFIGLKPESDKGRLKTSGVLSKIRHPLYAGGLLMIVGYALFAPTVTNWITCLLLIIYLIAGIYIEENRLLRTFGDEYVKYKTRTDRLIPGVW